MIRRHALLAYLSIAFCSACDPGWSLDIAVEVPVEVQNAYAGRLPAQVVVFAEREHADAHGATVGSKPLAIAVICDVSDKPLVFHRQLDGGMACSTELKLHAWLAPMGAQTDVACGELAPEQRSAPTVAAPTPELAQADGIAFKGRDDRDKYCEGGDESVTLELSLPAAMDDSDPTP
jgi:hypothetical protein